MAPEIIKGEKYNNKVDIWSLGSCFYHMIFGEYPFNSNNIENLQKLILNGKLRKPSGVYIDLMVWDLIKKMLIVNPKKRIGWEELFTHPINLYRENKVLNEIT